VYYQLGTEKAVMYLTAYIVEKSLSVDNLFVFLVAFGYFGIHPMYQPRVPMGILAHCDARDLIVIGVGGRLQMDVLGAILIVTAYRLIRVSTNRLIRQEPVLKFVSRHLPVSTELLSKVSCANQRCAVRDAATCDPCCYQHGSRLCARLDPGGGVYRQDLFIVSHSLPFSACALYFALMV
jgi:hypothetical protein